MRPGAAETLLILDRPSELQAYALGKMLLIEAHVSGAGRFDEHFFERITDFKNENPYTFPTPVKDELFIDRDEYETTHLAIESIITLHDHQRLGVVIERFRRKRIAGKILSQLDQEKNRYDANNSGV